MDMFCLLNYNFRPLVYWSVIISQFTKKQGSSISNAPFEAIVSNIRGVRKCVSFSRLFGILALLALPHHQHRFWSPENVLQ